ncbi:hypothetical protein SAMN03159341_13235 [Paenibacillus sp. 1_12]|nr:hypothetical protein SAMN03159341_13235 [Paenibacillus sp. 1_12]
MKCCTFCSRGAQLLFNHPTIDIGSLCMECYLKFHGSCGICNGSFLPTEIKPDVTYQVQVKFIGTGEKNFVVCYHCHEAIHQKFPQMFA